MKIFGERAWRLPSRQKPFLRLMSADNQALIPKTDKLKTKLRERVTAQRSATKAQGELRWLHIFADTARR